MFRYLFFLFVSGLKALSKAWKMEFIFLSSFSFSLCQQILWVQIQKSSCSLFRGKCSARFWFDLKIWVDLKLRRRVWTQQTPRWGARPVPRFVYLDHHGRQLVKYDAHDIALTTFLAEYLLAKKKRNPYSSWTAQRTGRKSTHRSKTTATSPGSTTKTAKMALLSRSADRFFRPWRSPGSSQHALWEHGHTGRSSHDGWLELPFHVLQSNTSPFGVSLITANKVDSMSPAQQRQEWQQVWGWHLQNPRSMDYRLAPSFGWAVSAGHSVSFVRCLEDSH